MLHREIIVVCSQSHTNGLCEQNAELLNVKPGGTYSNHWALRGVRNMHFIDTIYFEFPMAQIIIITTIIINGDTATPAHTHHLGHQNNEA